jgi:hypothetical protein
VWLSVERHPYATSARLRAVCGRSTDALTIGLARLTLADAISGDVGAGVRHGVTGIAAACGLIVDRARNASPLVVACVRGRLRLADMLAEDMLALVVGTAGLATAVDASHSSRIFAIC